LGRIFIHLSWISANPTIRLSLLSWLAGSLSVGVFITAMRRMGVGRIAALAGAAFFALFPSVSSMFVQPEKYAVLSLLLCIWLYATTVELEPWVLGVLAGLTLCQHPVAVTLAPMMMVAGWRAIGARPNGFRRAGSALASAAIVVALGYGSLWWMRAPGLWPDWGKISNLRELIQLATRADFKSLEPRGLAGGPSRVSCLRFFLGDYWDALGIFSVLPLIGLVALAMQKNRERAVAIGGTLFVVMVFLGGFAFSINDLPGYAYIERFSVLPMVFLAALAALGWQWGADWLPKRLVGVSPLLLLLLSGSLLHAGWQRTDLSRDTVLDRFAEALGKTLPSEAVFVFGQDSEMFYGAVSPDSIRYPVFGDYAWALERVNPLLDSRYAKLPKPPGHLADFVAWACGQGLETYATMRGALAACGGHLQRRGIFWSARREPQPEFGPATIRAALELCPIVEQIQAPIPREGHFYSRYLLRWFEFAFQNASAAYELAGDHDRAELAGRAGAALGFGILPEDWRVPCADLRARSSN
jgi:hypothetical protein